MFIILLVYKFLSLLKASCLASPRPKKGEGLGVRECLFCLTLQRYDVFQGNRIHYMKKQRTICEFHKLYVTFLFCTKK